MTLNNIADRILETDVLVVGGGISGCPVAIKARENGLDVILVEKAKTDRSGSAAAGIDHLGAAVTPDFSELDSKFGTTVFRGEGFWEPVQGAGRFADPNIMEVILKNGAWAMQELERIGVPMKWDNGQYYLIPSLRYRGEIKSMLRVHWKNVKPIMAQVVRERGVQVLERTMIVDLLTNGRTVVGATAINTRTGEFLVIKARIVVMATGLFARCYDPETPLIYKYKYRYHWCPATVSGDGWAASYRAGAEIANMDLPLWRFRERDDLTISHGNFPHGDGITARQLTWDGHEIMVDDGGKYGELERQGKTPLYYSHEDLLDDFHKRMEVAYVDERMISFKIAQDRGFDPRTHRFEQMSNKPHNFPAAGINSGDDFQTTLKGLYAVGDCVNGMHGCSGATTSAFLVGNSLPKSVSEAKEPVINGSQVENQKRIAMAPTKVTDGTEPTELESAVRYICDRYVGMFRSEGKLREGLRRLGSLKREFEPKLMAKNPHYLMRCLEVRNIMDLAELHIKATLSRKETRVGFIRVDYPDLDHFWDNKITYQRVENDKQILETREVPELRGNTH